jgi:hypothetical protein
VPLDPLPLASFERLLPGFVSPSVPSELLLGRRVPLRLSFIGLGRPIAQSLRFCPDKAVHSRAGGSVMLGCAGLAFGALVVASCATAAPEPRHSTAARARLVPFMATSD